MPRPPASALVLPLLLAAAHADDDYDDDPFSLRFPAALTRFSRYPDTAGTAGASAGAIWGSSANPAGTGWLSLHGLSIQDSRVDFDAGTKVGVQSASYSFPVEGWGTFQASLARAESNEATTRDGLDFGYQAWFGEMQWAKKFTDSTAYGANVSFARARADFGVGGAALSRSGSSQWGLRAGVLHEFSEGFRGGFAADYARSWDETFGVDPATGTAGAVRDRTSQILLRPGVAIDYGKARRVYLDLQFGSFRNDEESLSVHRLIAGVDHEIQEWINVRAGTLIDAKGDVALSLGVGIFPSERVFIDIGWQRNMFPEVAKEFGRSDTFGIAVSITF